MPESRTILSLGESADAATARFRTFEDGEPDLILTGIGPVDAAIGGLFPGAGGVLAAGTGVGKSSIKLSAALSAAAQGVKVGLVELEDTKDVVGARALAWASGVNSMDIRTKNFSPGDIEKLADGRTKLNELENIEIAYCIGEGIDVVEDAVTELCDRGCRMIWIDYIQKIRGGSQDRRNEVASNYTRLQRVCNNNDAACMVVSQFRRQPDPTAEPQISWLKETGDLENEARLIILMQKDPDSPSSLIGRMAKCNYGGEGTQIRYNRDESGTLVLHVPTEEEERDF